MIEDLNKRNPATNESDDEDVADGNVYQNKAVLEQDTKNRFPSIKPGITTNMLSPVPFYSL